MDPIKRKISDKPRSGDILQGTWLVRLRKNKESLGKCHRPEQIDETRQNAKMIPWIGSWSRKRISV